MTSNILVWLLLCATFAFTFASSRFELVVALKQHRLDEFENLFWEIATPGSSEYLEFRTIEQISGMIGAADEEISNVQEWLMAAGGSDIRVSSLRDMVSATFDSSHTLLMSGQGLPLSTTYPSCVEFVIRRDQRREFEADGGRQGARDKLSDSRESYTIENIKDAYGIPSDLQATNDATTQMVWGPGTFGYSPVSLRFFKETQCPLINLDKVIFDTENHGQSGGDNFGEGQLDVKMITSFGLNVTTLVSNTNTSASTEETTGFGAALLDFLTELATRPSLPHVLSMSLGSLSAASCDLLCTEVSKMGHTLKECHDYMAKQRQVCMFLSQEQTLRINTALMVLGTRGVTVLGSSGDGGSHFSFGAFSGGAIAEALNTVSCKYQIPVYPTASPYIVSVGGEMWGSSSADPITWAGYGGGSGSGFSIQFPAPSHQANAVLRYLNTAGSALPPSSSFNASNRAYPDIAAVGVQGTSQSCPIFAGIFSMLIDARLNAGLKPLGFVAPRIYQVAEQYPGQAFEDITSGNSKTSCDNGFPSTKGWDPNTGFGRPIWGGLVKYFAEDTYLLPLDQ